LKVTDLTELPRYPKEGNEEH
jgi:hypothetical protein